MEEKLKKIFDTYTAERKAGGWYSLVAKALRVEEDNSWLVAIYYKQGKKLFSVIPIENLSEENAKKVAESFNKFIAEIK